MLRMDSDKKLNVVINPMKFCLENIDANHVVRGDVLSLNNFTFRNGKKFPKSYIDFVEYYGYGLSADLFIIYIPLYDYPDSFFLRSDEIISTYQDVLDDEDELWFDLEPDLKYGDLKNLVPFAMSENGHYLFWNIESTPAENEFDIYITDFRGLGFTKVASNLYDFFDSITSKEDYKKVLPFSNDFLPKIFQPYNLE